MTLPACRQRDYASLNSHMIPKHAAAPFAKTLDASLSASPRHPLDPLDAAELEEAVRILAIERQLGDSVRIVSINLMEPPKNLVEKHQLGSPFERRALAVLLDPRQARHRTRQWWIYPIDPSPSVTPLPSGIQLSLIMLDEFQ